MMIISAEQVASAISSLGYEVVRSGKGYKFHWNSKHTPDSQINENGTIHRWTDRWHGDLVDFLRVNDPKLSFKEATEKAEELTSTKVDLSIKPEVAIKEDKPIPLPYLAKFHLDRKANFDSFSTLLRCLLPTVKSAAKRKEIATKFRLGYVKETDKILIPHFEVNGDWMTSAKYTPTPQTNFPKISFSKGRTKIPFGLPELLSYRRTPDKWILICEGHKDTLNAIANGYNAVTPGSASDSFREKDLGLFRGMKVCIMGDYDDAGFKFNERIKKQLEGIASIVKVVDWETVCAINKLDSPTKGLDFTDFLLATRR
jgi:DNA primase